MAGVDVTFRYNGAGADVANAIPPGFAFTVLPDGFMVTVPVGYTVHVNPLYPPILQVVGGGQVPNPGGADVQVPNPINPVVRIMQASANRILTQSEVLHLLQHDTLQLLPRVVKKLRSGLFMYPMAIIRQRIQTSTMITISPMTFRYDASYSINLWDTDVINYLHI